MRKREEEEDLTANAPRVIFRLFQINVGHLHLVLRLPPQQPAASSKRKFACAGGGEGWPGGGGGYRSCFATTPTHVCYVCMGQADLSPSETRGRASSTTGIRVA